jgi:flavin reductase (DIM6/NTAB) family NADH-FMN oxidoreductase RutF/DNA-binding GntR family transcriptional regulator
MSSTSAEIERRRLSPNEFREVIGHFASGVTVITAMHAGTPYGTTASAVSSLSLEPPMLLVCMNKQSSTGRAIVECGRFAVNILSEGQADAAVRFATKRPDKFRGLPVTRGVGGTPLLEDALATLECRVTEEVTGGTHSVFLAEVDGATARTGAPLAYFRGQFGRLELAQDDIAFRDIRSQVMNRDIPVGQPLSLDVLAARTGVPRGSVYHALAKLTGGGLVTRDSDGAFIVRPLSLEALQEGLTARCAIELGAAALTVGKLPADRLAELRQVVERSRPTPAEDFDMSVHLGRYSAVQEEFVRLSDSPALVDAYRRVNAPAMIMSLTTARAAKRSADHLAAEDAFRHHLALLDAYEAGDLELANREITSHMDHTITYTRRHMDAAGGLL